MYSSFYNLEQKQKITHWQAIALPVRDFLLIYPMVRRAIASPEFK